MCAFGASLLLAQDTSRDNPKLTTNPALVKDRISQRNGGATDSLTPKVLGSKLESIEAKINESIDSYPYLRSLLVNLLAGILIFYAGVYLEELKSIVRRPCVRKFWGKYVFGNDFAIVYGALQDPRLRPPKDPPENRFLKDFPGGVSIPLIGPWFDILSACEVRAASHIISTISKFRRRPLTVIDDLSAIVNLERSMIVFGSPSSNAVSKLVMDDKANRFVEFDSTGRFIRDKQRGKNYSGSGRPLLKDIGFILKLKNSRFSGHFFFVCAGLGEWGTSGAAWYLSYHWKQLIKEGDEFAIILEVTAGSDSSATRVGLGKEEEYKESPQVVSDGISNLNENIQNSKSYTMKTGSLVENEHGLQQSISDSAQYSNPIQPASTYPMGTTGAYKLTIDDSKSEKKTSEASEDKRVDI